MKLAATEHGAGPALVILHGLFGSARNWASVARRLSAWYRVIALDLRNHGESPWAATMTYAEMADDVAEYIDAAGIDPPVVLGHSMGGKVAMTMALEGRVAPAALVVVDIAPVTYRAGFAHLAEVMSAVDLASIHRRGDADAALADAVPDAALRAFLLQNLVARDGGYAWRINLAAIAAGLPALSDFPATESAFTGDTQFIAGERSGYVRESHHRAIRRAFPNAEIAVMDGAGHWPHAEQPENFMALLKRFLDQRSP